jgi:hypothetical protein
MTAPRRLLAAAAAALVAAAPAAAARLDSSYWSLSGDQVIKIKSLGTQVETVEGAVVSVGGDGSATLSFPGHDSSYGGTVTDKGKKGFVFTPDANALVEWELFVVGLIEDELGADSVEILSSKLAVTGKATLDEGGAPTEILVKLKAKAKASVDLGGITRKGAGSIKGVFVGTPSAP